jgi:hypothetical protein
VGAYFSKAMLMGRRLLSIFQGKLQHMSVTTLINFEDSMLKTKTFLSISKYSLFSFTIFLLLNYFVGETFNIFTNSI